MSIDRGEVIFENRHDAGRQLAAKLSEYNGQSVVVLAIPNGGVPVALEVKFLYRLPLKLVSAPVLTMEQLSLMKT